MYVDTCVRVCVCVSQKSVEAFQCVKSFNLTLSTCCVSGSVPGTGDIVLERPVQSFACGAHTKQTDARL